MITSTAHLLRFSPSLSPNLHHRSLSPPLHKRSRSYGHSYKLLPGRRSFSSTLFAKAIEFKSPSAETSQQQRVRESTVLLDVTGMMCGACVSRVKSILSSDERIDSVVVNMLTETAAIKLKDTVEVDDEEFANRLTECGFPSKKRVSGLGIEEKVKKWKETVEKKEALLLDSRNRVAFAWTLVALCCGGHASHILHSLGIHIAHGSIFEVLHNPYLKGGLALGSLFGPGRDLLFDGLNAFRKRSPNMNSLVGFGSIAAFALSAVSLFNPALEWDASFFDEPHAGYASWFCSAGTLPRRKGKDSGIQ